MTVFLMTRLSVQSTKMSEYIKFITKFQDMVTLIILEVKTLKSKKLTSMLNLITRKLLTETKQTF